MAVDQNIVTIIYLLLLQFSRKTLRVRPYPAPSAKGRFRPGVVGNNSIEYAPMHYKFEIKTLVMSNVFVGGDRGSVMQRQERIFQIVTIFLFLAEHFSGVACRSLYVDIDQHQPLATAESIVISSFT